MTVVKCDRISIILETNMGLSVSHGCWRGAYNAFHAWRVKIAEVSGFPPLCLMEAFWIPGEIGDPIKYLPEYLQKEISGSLPIKWEPYQPDPLIILLRHSDSNGEIAWQDCFAIAQRLEEIIHLLPAEDDPGHIGNWNDKTQKFIDGLRLAHELQENIIFA